MDSFFFANRLQLHVAILRTSNLPGVLLPLPHVLHRRNQNLKEKVHAHVLCVTVCSLINV